MRYAWLVSTLVACGGSEVGQPCSLDDPCEGGVCDFTDPGGPVCIDSDGDLDGDGIRNDKDFCHHAPGGEFDEDRDGIGDECDRCPIALPAAEPDADGDEVESPCDPDPAIGGDRIVVFEGFNGGALPTGFKATAGWSFLPGEAVATPPDPVTEEVLTAPLPLVSLQIALLGQYRIDGVQPQSTQNIAGVKALDVRPAGGTSVQCAGTRSGTTDRLILVTDTTTGQQTFTNLFNTSTVYRVAMRLDRSEAACAMIADDEQGAAQATTGGEAMNEAGFITRGATARYQYLMVIQRGPIGD